MSLLLPTSICELAHPPPPELQFVEEHHMNLVVLGSRGMGSIKR